MKEFDFMVIGSGSGLEVANAAARQEQSVAVIEKGPLGGTCLNRGCIPSKMLLYHADVLETVERAHEFNIQAEVTDVDFAEIVREVNDDVSGNAESIRDGLRSSENHELFEAEARFVGERTVELSGVESDDETGGQSDDGASGQSDEVDGERVRAETVLIAAGTRPTIPDIEGIDGVDYLTSTEALQLETPPDHLLIVGGGYIAAELAQFFGTFGSDVTIVGRQPDLLPEADEEVAAEFTERYVDRFELYTGFEAVGAAQSDGEITLTAEPYSEADTVRRGGDAVENSGDVDPVEVSGDALLVAAGRRPNTDTLNVEATGVETDDGGFVETDEFLRTTAEDVWALGDIVGEYLLKHSANHEARTVQRNLFGDEREPIDYTAMPFAVFASPEVAGVGAREEELREDGREYATHTYRYEDTARGSAMKVEGLVKVLIDFEGTILGCHIVGPEASNLVEEVVVSMKAGSGTVRDIRDSVHIHPALSEVVQRAFSGQFTPGEGSGHSHDHSTDHSHDHSHDHQRTLPGVTETN